MVVNVGTCGGGRAVLQPGAGSSPLSCSSSSSSSCSSTCTSSSCSTSPPPRAPGGGRRRRQWPQQLASSPVPPQLEQESPQLGPGLTTGDLGHIQFGHKTADTEAVFFFWFKERPWGNLEKVCLVHNRWPNDRTMELKWDTRQDLFQCCDDCMKTRLTMAGDSDTKSKTKLSKGKNNWQWSNQWFQHTLHILTVFWFEDPCLKTNIATFFLHIEGI